MPARSAPRCATCSARWPRAKYVEDFAATAPTARRIFDAALWRQDQPLRVVLIGTDFEVRVWERLLDIPMGKLTTYSDLAAKAGAPKAARAVGAAVGKNPICFVVPCHRVIGKSGDITGYHWGLTRKRAMLGWEAGMAAACIIYAARSSFDFTVEFGVEPVDDRHAGGEFALEDALRRQTLQHHHQRAQRIAVRRHQHALAAQHARQNFLDVIGQHARQRVLQALAAGRRDVIGAAPDVHLLLAPFLARVVFVEARRDRRSRARSAPGP